MTKLPPYMFVRAGAKRQPAPWVRADGRTLCAACGKPYSAHPRDSRSSWLVVLCDGRRVKL
jgi:hypothetical protein